MKINFLTTALSDRTGGSKYDEQLYRALINRFGESSIALITDSCFDGVSGGWTAYRKAYLEKLDLISNCDSLISNSRLYTRFSFAANKVSAGVKRLILIHHHFNYQTHSGVKRAVHKRLEMAFLDAASCIITPNDFTMDELRRLGYGDKSVLLEASISFPAVESEIRSEQVLFIGTCEPRKGIEYGIRAFSAFHTTHPNYKLLIVGARDSYPKYQEKLDSLVGALGLTDSVCFLGRVSDAEKEELLTNSRLFLFPSQNEGYGIALLEAMSHGLPVVAFDNTAMPYTVTSSNGRLVKNRDTDAMANALCEIVDTPGLWEQLSGGAYAQAAKADSTARLHDEYENLFRYLGVTC